MAFERGEKNEAKDRRIAFDTAEERERKLGKDRAVVSFARERNDGLEQVGRGGALVEDGRVHRLFARKVAVQRGLGDADCRGDVAGRRAAEAVGAEKTRGFLEKLGAAGIGRQSLALGERGGH